MGQVFTVLPKAQIIYNYAKANPQINNESQLSNRFPDLNKIPHELAYIILSKLNATDLCLAACVWKELANDELLWRGLCQSQWPYCSAYKNCNQPNFSSRTLYLRLDEGRLTFNADSFLGMEYFFKHNILDNDALEIARFFHYSRNLNRSQMQRYLEKRNDILDHLMKWKNFERQFLPNALRNFFQDLPVPQQSSEYLSNLVARFSDKFIECNPDLSLSPDLVYILCFSLIMLSVDLNSPHVKNKMSKREFIRNTRQAANVDISSDFLGHLYDNVYLIGHIAPEFGKKSTKQKNHTQINRHYFV